MYRLLILTLCTQFTFGLAAQTTYQSNWQGRPDMTWTGPELWANRLQDWQIREGSLECNISGANRSVALMTHTVKPGVGFEMVVEAQWLNRTPTPGIMGFRFGVKGKVDDYRSAAIYGKGINAGINKKGHLIIGESESPEQIDPLMLQHVIRLHLHAQPAGNGNMNVVLSATDQKGAKLASYTTNLSTAEVSGQVTLLCDLQSKGQQDFIPGARFSNWQLTGPAVEQHPQQVYGPIYFAMYTLSGGTVKLSAQCAPTNLPGDSLSLFLQINKEWRLAAKSAIDPVSRIAAFRLENWSHTAPIPYRLAYQLPLKSGIRIPYTYEGSVAPEPPMEQSIKLGLFSCNFDHGFPDQDLRDHILKHKINAALFLGDQFYEASGGFGVEETTLERSVLDYLRKWYQFGWSYRDVFRQVPMISIPDDHDVYHGNVWGEGGKAALLSGAGYERQDVGGYKMPADWVNMVQQTQTSHLPDAFDPTPVTQNIPVYYTHWNWGPLSFAIIEDRKFKSAPKNIFPPEAKVANGFITNPDFELGPYNAPPNGQLLGERQEKFLEAWTQDWSHGARMKILLSQTNFCTLATLPKGSTSDAVVPSLPTPKPGEYVQGDAPTRDMDSNGWPHNKRNKAVDLIRRGFTLHLAGDQHLASVVQYGVDEWGDAGFAFSGPALNNVWPRRWWPQIPAGQSSLPGQPAYTGNFEDGFSNKVTVHAVANPQQRGLEPAIIHDRMTGYGIIDIHPAGRNITLNCWPRSVDPDAPGARQYPGWPLSLHQQDNYGRQAYGYLPNITVQNYTNPVFQVVHAASGEVLYTLRIQGNSFQPKVFAAGEYTVRIGEPDTGRWVTLDKLEPGAKKKKIKVRL